MVASIGSMRLLQIDTINVVARSPYLVLFARLGAYRMEWLEQALASGAIFECWAHEASFAPAADLSLHVRHGAARDGHWSMRNARRARAANGPAIDALLDHIRENGAVKTSDFQRTERAAASGWWGWKNEKRWLESLFASGELMIARRDNFQRVYDLRERVLANATSNGNAAIDADVSEAAMRQAFTLGAVQALGITQARWINDYFRSGRKLKDADLEPLVERGELLRMSVCGWKNAAYVHPSHTDAVAQAGAGRLRATHTTLLSPFDPVVWDRERASAMFGFDYRIECYTPAPKRRYGYFVLPILDRGQLIGRLDAKAHRRDGVFEVKALFLEPGVARGDDLIEAVAGAIVRCADWHEAPKVIVQRTDPPSLRRALQSRLKIATGQ